MSGRLLIPRYEGLDVIGLPADGHAITWSNSEREDFACPSRWWYRHVERLAVAGTFPKRLGTLWHAVLEEVYRWWAHTDSDWPIAGMVGCPWCQLLTVPVGTTCPRCAGTGLGVGMRIRAELAADVRAFAANATDAPAFTQEDASELVETLSRMIGGWFRKYGVKPPRTLRVAGVEVAVARVILNPATGRPYCPETDLVRLADGSTVLAATGQSSGEEPIPPGAEVVTVKWPWFQVMRYDAVFVHRESRVLWVGEWKSSADPGGLVADLNVDPQTAGYLWGADQPDVLARFNASEVAGFLFDVASSHYQHDPEPLKGRPTKAVPNPPLAFSQARNRSVPSWRYEAALRANGMDPAPYAAHLAYLAATVDPKLYRREFGAIGPEERARYAVEAFALASRLSTARRAVARAKTPAQLVAAVPRVPICRLPGGSCAFRGPCVTDGEDARRRFDVTPGQRWEAPAPDPRQTTIDSVRDASDSGVRESNNQQSEVG